MFELDTITIALAGIAFIGAAVNGGLGYGFSSITVPVALLFVANRVLNPALVLLEVGVNLVSLAVNRRALPKVARRISPMLLGLVPGVALGTFALASVDQGSLKLVTFAVLLPLIVLQTAGLRWPIKNERLAGAPLGAAVGTLYAATTISGPPLALLLNNQGLARDDFRAALALFRTVEAILTAFAYLWLGLFTAESVKLSAAFLPSVAIGLPLGFFVLRRLNSESFRRLCMGADGVLVSFALSRIVVDRQLLRAEHAYAALAVIGVLEAVLVARHLLASRKTAVAVPAVATELAS